MVLPLHRRSILQPYYKELYESNRQNKLLEEMERQLTSKWVDKRRLSNVPQSIYEGLMSTLKVVKMKHKE